MPSCPCGRHRFTRVSNARLRSSTLPAAEVEARLVSALHDLDAARKSAVIWFGEILSRKLYLEFGCSSIYHYAHERLGFSRGEDRVLPATLPLLRAAARAP